MLTIHHSTASPLCDGLTRRDWLTVGGLGLLGMGVLGSLAARTSVTSGGGFGKAKSVILLCFLGGPAQQETWDPKPDALAEVRGPFKPIASNVPGIQVSELMPRTAKHLDKICVLRAMSTGDNSHSSSGYYMLTGRPHQPPGVENALPGAPNNWPSLAAIVKKMLPGNGTLPPAIAYPDNIWNDGNIPWPGQDAGFLGRAADPWLIRCDPTERDFRVPELGLPDEVPSVRFDDRRSLLEQVNRGLDRADAAGVGARWDVQSRQVFDLLRASRARTAFDLAQEPVAMRERYGNHKFGQGALLARRLVEVGVPLVQVNWVRGKFPNDPNQGMWDTHSKHDVTMKDILCPLMDQAYSTLLEDLAARGLLDSTLVVWMGEFGRTPKYNAGGGRDHWGHVFSAALAGGGVRGGQVIGASDKSAAYPKEGKVRPEDLSATVLHGLGIAPDGEMRDTLNRPLPLCTGEVVRGAF